MSPIDEAEFLKVGAQIEKKWGKGTVRNGSDMPSVLHVPSGSYSFDYMSDGGPPVRRWSRFFGGESSAKSLTSWNIVKNAQNYHIIMDEKLAALAEAAKDMGDKEIAKDYLKKREHVLATWPNGMDVCYYNVEQTYDPDFVAAAGVDIDRLKLSEATVIEEVGDAMEGFLHAGVDLHVIDSCSSAIPLQELNMDVTEQRRGLSAKQWGLIMRRAKKRFQPNNMGIIIDQVRINQQTGAEEAPGGKYLDHASDLTVHFRRGKWLYYDNKGVLRDNAESGETMTGMKEADGIEITARVSKSRVCRPFRTARMRIDFDGMEIDQGYELKEAAVWYGVVNKKGGGYYDLPNGETVRGEAAIREAVSGDIELKEKIIKVWEEDVR